ncbi:hypothetical protein [Rickettsiales endosymbiont of Trichoplax sp. H2]|uniref:hypothetical protein n=1 Tax=Rickettsiales endosymbiont of Trichoplax sp. H2 TaxID=2021221 RepID=UPI0012B2B2C7|nr:hypothetical protein [Rickettsiales endosymbiont of Trichoplax sp. H2]
MKKNIEKSLTFLLNKRFIMIIYSIAFITIVIFQYRSYIEQIIRNEITDLSHYVRARLSVAKNYSYDNFQLIEYIDKNNLFNNNIKHILDNNRAKKLFFLDEIYKYDSVNQDLFFTGINESKISIQNLKTNPTILQCIKNKGNIKFGQIYINDHYEIVSCYRGDQYVYLRLINFRKLVRGIKDKYSFSKNYRILISDKYNRILYVINDSAKVLDKNLANIPYLKEGMVFLSKNKEKRYTRISGYGLFEKSYSLVSFRDKSFKIFVEEISSFNLQNIINFLKFDKLLIIIDLIIFLILASCVLVGIIYPLNRISTSLKKYMKLEGDKNLSNLKVIDILKHDYLKLQNQYKNIYLKYHFVSKFLKKFIVNYKDNYKDIVHNFNTPLHQIQLSIQSIESEHSNTIVDNKKIKIIDKASKQLLANCELFFSDKKLLRYSLDSKKSNICLAEIIKDLLNTIFNMSTYDNLRISKNFTTTNTIIIEDKIFVETVMYFLLDSSKKLIDEISFLSVYIHEILTGLEISIIFEGNKIKKGNVQEYVNYIDNKLDLNYFDESKLDILIINYFVNLLGLDLSFQTNDKNIIKYKLIIPNIKIKS